MPATPLFEKDIAALKAKPAAYKRADGGGLYLLVSPTGAKLWRFDYRFTKRQKPTKRNPKPPAEPVVTRCTLAFGAWPEVPLAVARKLREDAKAALREGRDPGAAPMKAEEVRATGPTFQEAALKWMADHTANLDPAYGDLILRRLSRDIFPEFGATPIGDVSKATIRAALVKAQARGLGDTVRRCCASTSPTSLSTPQTIWQG